MHEEIAQKSVMGTGVCQERVKLTLNLRGVETLGLQEICEVVERKAWPYHRWKMIVSELRGAQ